MIEIITTVQACEERLEYITPIVKDFDPIIHVDYKKKGSLATFIDMLDYKVKDYRFHLQDDVIIADNLVEYLPIVAKFMKNNNIPMLTFFYPARNSAKIAYENGKRFMAFSNFLGPLGSMFSREFIEEMRIHSSFTKQTHHDDFFIEETLTKMGKKPVLHLPILVQHNINITSVNGHPAEPYTTSDIFDKNFVTNHLNL